MNFLRKLFKPDPNIPAKDDLLRVLTIDKNDRKEVEARLRALEMRIANKAHRTHLPRGRAN